MVTQEGRLEDLVVEAARQKWGAKAGLRSNGSSYWIQTGTDEVLAAPTLELLANELGAIKRGKMIGAEAAAKLIGYSGRASMHNLYLRFPDMPRVKVGGGKHRTRWMYNKEDLKAWMGKAGLPAYKPRLRRGEPKPGFLTTAQVAKLMGVAVHNAGRTARNRGIPFKRIGARLVWEKAPVMEAISEWNANYDSNRGRHGKPRPRKAIIARSRSAVYDLTTNGAHIDKAEGVSINMIKDERIKDKLAQIGLEQVLRDILGVK